MLKDKILSPAAISSMLGAQKSTSQFIFYLTWKTYFTFCLYSGFLFLKVCGSQVSALVFLSQHSLAFIHLLGPLYHLWT